MENDCLFVIMGATGDLAKRKLFPAIYHLVKNKKIKNFAVIGTGRRKVTAKQLLGRSKPFIKDIKASVWKKVVDHTTYHRMDFYNKEDYESLHDLMYELQRAHKLSGNRLFYLATLPDHFETITKHFGTCSFTRERSHRWLRLVYEKPFGHDLPSAQHINRCIRRVFSERHVYRIDHYLGKELVENIAFLRFTNRVLEPLWNRHHIESVQVILDEAIGVESRGHFYDKEGVLNDVVQNHALQLLALAAMEEPRHLDGDSIRSAKAAVLRKTRVKDLLQGQYKGYRKEEGVKRHSQTATFAALELRVNNKRWKGVPFYIKAGKGLQKKNTSIILKFKSVECLLTKSCPTDTNYLVIRVQPEESISLEVNVKIPESKALVAPVRLNFSERCTFGHNSPEAYETLIENVIEGDQSVFVRNDEIEYAWKIIDKVKSKKRPVFPYVQGSEGPKELKEWSKERNLRWHV